MTSGKNFPQLTLELEGDIYLIEKYKNKTIRSKIDGKLALEAVLYAIEEGLDLLYEKYKKENKTSKPLPRTRKKA